MRVLASSIRKESWHGLTMAMIIEFCVRRRPDSEPQYTPIYPQPLGHTCRKRGRPQANVQTRHHRAERCSTTGVLAAASRHGAPRNELSRHSPFPCSPMPIAFLTPRAIVPSVLIPWRSRPHRTSQAPQIHSSTHYRFEEPLPLLAHERSTPKRSTWFPAR